MDSGVLFFIWFGVLAVLCVILVLIPNVRNFLAQLFIPFASIKDDYDSILKKQSAYYNKLSFDQKDEFIKRIYLFLRGKKISGTDGVTIGETEKLSIAAAAVQLTFGLERNRFPDFDRIIVHANAYQNSIDHLAHRGDTMEDGTIQLSWKYFTEGFAVGDDGVNLGLHEMAHALELEKMIIGTSFRGSFAAAYSNWEKSADMEMVSMRQTHKGFLRIYAEANLHEFFACCVEAFFERPDAFKENLPVLYEDTCLMLHQDPAKGIYRLVSG